MKDYSFHEYSHSFAAWAAGRAASTKRARLTVQTARKLLEEVGFTAEVACLSEITTRSEIDTNHEIWRTEIVGRSGSIGLDMTHGIAAKLINVYTKARFTAGNLLPTEAAGYMHPPIDRLLLLSLAQHRVGHNQEIIKLWKVMGKKGWSNFTSGDYQSVIDNVRGVTPPGRMWAIEKFWKGYQ